MINNYSAVESSGVTPPQWPRLQRPKPKNQANETSALYDESQKMKLNMNKFKEENVKLKTKIQQAGKEMDKKEKIIQELLQQVQNDSGSAQPRHFMEAPLVLSLKKQLKDVKEEEKQKDEELKELKNGLKVNKLKEKEAQLKQNEDECYNLKEMVIDLIKNQPVSISPGEVSVLEEKLRQQEALIRNYKQENFDLANMLRKKEEDLGKFKESSISLEKKVAKVESTCRDNQKNKKIIADNHKEIDKIKEQITIYKVDNKEKEAATLKLRVDELLKKQVEINDKIKQKDKLIDELEQKANKFSSPVKENQYLTDLKQLRIKIETCIF